jgi:hypothetical protein
MNPLFDQMENPERQRLGLAGTRSRNDQKWTLGTEGCLLLLGIERIEVLHVPTLYRIVKKRPKV